MSETNRPESESDPNLAAALAHAERRRAMLEELAQVCLILSKKIARDLMDGPFHPESRHDPARALAVATRSVRLTLVLEAKVGAEIIALRKGQGPVAPVWPAPRTDAGEAPAVVEGLPDGRRPADSGSDDGERERDQDREPSREGVERETDGFDAEGTAFGRFRKRLIAGEDFQDLIEGDFNACTDEIRAGLGLDPLPPLHGEGRLGPSGPSGVGLSGSPETPGTIPDSPTPDFASLRLDPPHEGEGGSPNTDPPPCAPSVAARERAPPA